MLKLIPYSKFFLLYVREKGPKVISLYNKFVYTKTKFFEKLEGMQYKKKNIFNFLAWSVMSVLG